MKTLPLILTLVLLAGCSSVESRIKERSAVYAKLSPMEQQTIQRGYITMGFTPDMVYMALDKPESVTPGNKPGNESWIYHNFYSRDGSDLTAGQRVVTHSGPMAQTGGGGGAPGMKNAIGSTSGASGRSGNTFTVEPDLANEQIKIESHIRVRVQFVEGKVASIDIIRI